MIRTTPDESWRSNDCFVLDLPFKPPQLAFPCWPEVIPSWPEVNECSGAPPVSSPGKLNNNRGGFIVCYLGEMPL